MTDTQIRLACVQAATQNAVIGIDPTQQAKEYYAFVTEYSEDKPAPSADQLRRSTDALERTLRTGEQIANTSGIDFTTDRLPGDTIPSAAGMDRWPWEKPIEKEKHRISAVFVTLIAILDLKGVGIMQHEDYATITYAGKEEYIRYAESQSWTTFTLATALRNRMYNILGSTKPLDEELPNSLDEISAERQRIATVFRTVKEILRIDNIGIYFGERSAHLFVPGTDTDKTSIHFEYRDGMGRSIEALATEIQKYIRMLTGKTEKPTPNTPDKISAADLDLWDKFVREEKRWIYRMRNSLPGGITYATERSRLSTIWDAVKEILGEDRVGLYLQDEGLQLELVTNSSTRFTMEYDTSETMTNAEVAHWFQEKTKDLVLQEKDAYANNTPDANYRNMVSHGGRGYMKTDG